MDGWKDRFVGIILYIAVLDDWIFADEYGRNMRRDLDCSFGHFQHALSPLEGSASFLLRLGRRTDPEPPGIECRQEEDRQASTDDHAPTSTMASPPRRDPPHF